MSANQNHAVMLPVQASNLPFQLDFKFLSVPDLQPGLCAPDASDLDAVCRGGRSSSRKAALQGRDSCVPFNNPSPKAYASPAATKALAARQSCALHTEGMEFEAKDCVSMLQPSALDGMYDPGRVLRGMAAPKRFYRTFWRSVSFRLLRRWALSARPSCKQDLR
jgi:hypothetical protein